MLLVVNVISESAKDRYWPDVKVDDSITVMDLKDKLYYKTGTIPSSMELFAFSPSDPNNKIYLEDDAKSLEEYSIYSGFTIEIRESEDRIKFNLNIDESLENNKESGLKFLSLAATNPKLHEHYVRQMERSSNFSDENNFERYKISEEDYLKRNTGVRDFVNRMRTKTESKSRITGVERNWTNKTYTLKELVNSYPLDSRCVVYPGNRRGCVKYVGYVDSSNIKIGVSLDEPMGDSDGRCNDRRFFDTKPNYAGFFDPSDVLVGNYPPEDPFEIVQ